MWPKQLTPLSKFRIAHPHDRSEEGPDVGLCCLFLFVFVAGVHLGSHEGCCACYFGPFGVVGVGVGVCGGGETKVRKGEVIGTGGRGVFPKDVFGVEIAVDNFVGVEVLEREEHLVEDDVGDLKMGRGREDF